VDADGERVVGTFEGGEALGLVPGDQVALLDSGGAVASTSTVSWYAFPPAIWALWVKLDGS
jgi:hypothetical protein